MDMDYFVVSPWFQLLGVASGLFVLSLGLLLSRKGIKIKKN